MLRQLKAHLTDQQSRASFASLAVVATGAVLAFLMFTFIARTIGPNEFGRFATWFNIASFLAVVGALGQETFIGRSWNEYAGAERWDLAQGAVRFGALNVQIGAGCALLLFLAIGLIMHAEPALLLAGGLVVISHPLFVFLYQFTRAVVGHLKSDALYECVWRLVVILGLFGLSVSGLPMTTTGVLALVGFGYLSVSLCLLVLVRHQTPPAAWLATPKAETAVWRQRSVKFWLAALLEASGQYLDVVVVHLLLGEIAAGAYFAATRIANIFAKISQAFETRAASKLSYYYYRGDHAALGELLLGLSRTTLLVVAVGLPGMLVLGKLLLPVFAEIYAKEFPALAVLTIGTALVTLTGSARLVLLHTGHEGAYLRIISFGLLSRAVLFVALAPYFGTIGAALAWSVTAVAVSFALLRFCQQRLNLDPSVFVLSRTASQMTGAVPSSTPSVTAPRVILMQTQAEAAGAQEIARILGIGLAKRGYDVHHVFFFKRTDVFDSVPHTFYCAATRPNSVWSLLGVVYKLWCHLRQQRPAAVLTFQHYGNIMGAPIARLAGLSPVIANQNTSRAQMKPSVVKIDRLLGMSGIYSKIVVNSAQTSLEYAADPKTLRERLVRIDHGFEPKQGRSSKSEARVQFKLPSDAPVLGYVARLHPDKNHVAAIKLLAQRPHWHLALVGQGASIDELEAFATSLGVRDRLYFVGELKADQLGEFLRGLDVFVFPSILETFGLAAVEAAQAGIPVVSNDLEVLREVLAVDEKPCASFVDVNDTAAFAKAVDQVLTDADLRQQLTTRGRLLTERYSLDTMVDAYVRLLLTHPASQADEKVVAVGS